MLAAQYASRFLRTRILQCRHMSMCSDIMEAAIQTRRSGNGLSSEFYTDANIHQGELDLLWYKEWLFAGHECELQKPGDWLTMQVGKYPIIVVKGKDNEIRAFHNVCRHRGFKLCEGDSGNVKRRLVCPYHQWTYDLDGKLAFARDFKKDNDNFDKADYTLKPVAIGLAGGNIYITIANDPKPFEPLGELMETYLAPFDLRNAKVAHQTKIVENGNWKMVWENNRECYHCKGSHDELVVTFPEGAWWNGMSGTDEEKSIVKNLAQRCESLGLPSSFETSEDAQYRAMRIPLTNNAHSFTMDGQPAVTGKRLGTMPEGESTGDVLFYHYPNTWNHYVADHAITFRVLPISPTETELVTKWLVPADAVEGVDYDLKNLTHVWTETNDQDRALVERNQMGVSSPAYEPGPYNSVHEEGVSQFIDWYCNAILGHAAVHTVRPDASVREDLSRNTTELKHGQHTREKLKSSLK